MKNIYFEASEITFSTLTGKLLKMVANFPEGVSPNNFKTML